MKVLQINSVCGIRSTGRICTDIADVLRENGDECKVAYGRESVPKQYEDIAFRIGNDNDVKLHALASRAFDTAGFHSKRATRSLLKYIDEFSPDIIHLHNIHGYYLNVELLFDYLKERNLPVVWTLHDCWSFTGHCSHYASVGCEKWKSGCYSCPQKGEYPASLFLDGSKRNYERKKSAFCGIKNLTVVTPSEWLAEETRKSFLGEYRVVAIPNGIDTEVFKPTESDFRERYGLENKKIILGVATAWSEKKGLSKFIKLADLLGDDYKIVLVGLAEEQRVDIPKEILGLTRTNSAKELAEIYSAADLCVSLSEEETMGLTVVEANACGTPSMVFNKTALPELIGDKNGAVVNRTDMHDVCDEIKGLCSESFSHEDCVDHAACYEKQKMYQKYIDLYKEIVK